MSETRGRRKSGGGRSARQASRANDTVKVPAFILIDEDEVSDTPSTEVEGSLDPTDITDTTDGEDNEVVPASDPERMA